MGLLDDSAEELRLTVYVGHLSEITHYSPRITRTSELGRGPFAKASTISHRGAAIRETAANGRRGV